MQIGGVIIPPLEKQSAIFVCVTNCIFFFFPFASTVGTVVCFFGEAEEDRDLTMSSILQPNTGSDRLLFSAHCKEVCHLRQPPRRPYDPALAFHP